MPPATAAPLGTAPLVSKRIRFCFDLDNTLVTLPKVPGDYTTVEPILRNIELVRQLHAAGHHIIIQTSRGMRDHSGNLGRVMRDVGGATFNSLHDFGIPYDELLFGTGPIPLHCDPNNHHEDLNQPLLFAPCGQESQKPMCTLGIGLSTH